MVGGATFSWRYAGRFVMLAVYASIAFLLWCTFGPTRSQNEFPLYDDSVATHRKPPNLSISPNKTYSETIAIQSDETRVQPARIATRNVVIYAATKFFGHPITTERFLATCPDVQKYCRITQDEAEFANSDAVLFHNADYHGESSFKHLVKQRKPGVPFVLWSLESPSNDNFRPGSDVINWTMTYRRDADIFSPYGTIVKLETPVEIDLNAIWESKSKTATWLASNCFTQNHRFDLIKKMIDKGFDVEIWGNCGKQPGACSGVDNQESECVLPLIKPYKFYISMENSNCKDYVTEKFWKALNDRQTVPIVLARKYYKDLGVPDSAYIAVDDFETFDKFLEHVKKVNKDKELYLKYHQWRKEWKIVIGSGFSGWCTLCDKLQDKEYILSHPKSYHDVAWWHSFEMCNNQIAQKYL